MKKCLLILLLLLPFVLHAQIINSIAGGGLSIGDGAPATAAQVNLPLSGAFDAAGNYYFWHNLTTPKKSLILFVLKSSKPACRQAGQSSDKKLLASTQGCLSWCSSRIPHYTHS